MVTHPDTIHAQRFLTSINHRELIQINLRHNFQLYTLAGRLTAFLKKKPSNEPEHLSNDLGYEIF
jgi:hypothetical protein